MIFPKKKIKSPANIGTIPDAFVIDFKNRRWFIVEVELSRHRIYEHIIPQLTKFLNALKNPNTKNKLADAFYNYIKTDPYKIALLESNGIERDRYREILRILETTPDVVIIIDEITEAVREAVGVLSYPAYLIEFKTFVRKGSKELDDHIHLFETLSPAFKQENTSVEKPFQNRVHKNELVDLMREGMIRPGFRIYREYKGILYTAEILEDGRVRLFNDGTVHTSLSKAASHITKGAVNGWRWWKYKDENGTEHVIDDLRRRFN
ncbi:hypothetical protein JCM16138_24300 [Thermococcus atlanticus]